MNTKAKLSFGMAALVAAGTIGFAPASVDEGSAASGVVLAMVTTVVVASPETPQDQVWDMTYGSERAGVAEEMVAAEDTPIVDYTFG